MSRRQVTLVVAATLTALTAAAGGTAARLGGEPPCMPGNFGTFRYFCHGTVTVAAFGRTWKMSNVHCGVRRAGLNVSTGVEQRSPGFGLVLGSYRRDDYTKPLRARTYRGGGSDPFHLRLTIAGRVDGVTRGDERLTLKRGLTSGSFTAVVHGSENSATRRDVSFRGTFTCR